MDRFVRNDDRLQAFTRALWEALVPSSGECISMQGELIRAVGRLRTEHYRNGMCNYYMPDEPEHGFADGFYPRLLLFIADTIVANESDANDEATIEYFEEVRALAASDWDTQQIIETIAQREEDESRELSAAENAEIDALAAGGDRLDWEEFFDRAALAIANWCVANPRLVDRAGKPVEEGGVQDVRHVFDPPPPEPPCPLCNGKGWLAAGDTTQFASLCSCKSGAPSLLN